VQSVHRLQAALQQIKLHTLLGSHVILLFYIYYLITLQFTRQRMVAHFYTHKNNPGRQPLSLIRVRAVMNRPQLSHL